MATSNNEEAVSEAVEIEKVTFASFFETVPPGPPKSLIVEARDQSPAYPQYRVTIPEITLHCGSEACDGLRKFKTTSTLGFSGFNAPKDEFIRFTCKNCDRTYRTYAIRISLQGLKEAVAFKYGENPSFGPHTPSRVQQLIGPDREIFLQGRRSENQGFGIGAFAYYRRVVENQKGRIISQLRAAAVRLGATPQQLEAFDRALKENQFKTAVDLVKDAIPKSLLINEHHNPLVLLHSAISRDLHDGSDACCLQAASDIRIVLTELAERVNTALADHAEVESAVSRLLTSPKKDAPKIQTKE